jgi:hypothetical protein
MRLTDLSRFAYHVFMKGGVSQGFDDASAGPRAGSPVRRAITLGVIAVIVLVYRLVGVSGSALAGESAFALAALIPLVTMHRPDALKLRPAPSPEPPASGMATEMSAS